MRSLLRTMPSGVPAACLVARIRGRRSYLLSNWDHWLLTAFPLAQLPPAPWRPAAAGEEGWFEAVQAEHFWVFSRMDEPLRRAAAPFFWLAELHTVGRYLRLLADKRDERERLLRRSLLATEIVRLLQQADGCLQAVEGLTAVLAARDRLFAEMASSYRTAGIGSLEETLRDCSLRFLIRQALDPQMRTCLTLMIDSRNLTTVAKRLRWNMAEPGRLLPGGTIPATRLQELFARRDSIELVRLAMRLGGEAPYDELEEPERVLFASRSRVMARLAREPEELGIILAYLWRCGNEAANLGLLAAQALAGSERVVQELRR